MERALSVPMLVLSLLLIPVLLLPVVWERMPRHIASDLVVADYCIWAAFALEYLLLFALAPSRRLFAKTHPLELVLVVLPMLRPLRLLRSARVLRAARVGRAGTSAATATAISRRQLALNGVVYAPVAAAVVVLAGAVFVLDLERGAKNANITTLPGALWWSASTVLTVGYGDRVPVTAAGRLVAVALMIVGVALLGVVTASIAAWFIQWSTPEANGGQVATEDQNERAATVAELRALHAELAGLRRQIERAPPCVDEGTGGSPSEDPRCVIASGSADAPLQRMHVENASR